MPTRRMLAGSCLAALLALHVISDARAQAPEPAIAIMQKRGAMLVGMATFVPWAMRNEQGQLVGFEVDVATKLAKDLDLKLELVPTAWDGVIPALLAGKFDVIIGGMTITAKRNLTVNFSAPYDYAGTSLAIAKRLQPGFKPELLNDTRMTIACRRGATSCINVMEYFPKATLRQFDDDAAITQELLNGNVDAFAASEPLPSRVAAENPDKVAAPLTQAQELNRLPAGMAVRKGDADTLNVLNNWIQANTTFLQARRHYWFETQDWRTAVGKVN